jgi:hypothetical protein
MNRKPFYSLQISAVKSPESYRNQQNNRNHHCYFQKISYRDTIEGILAVAKTKSMQLTDLKLSENPLILIAEALEKTGNSRCIVSRTADAANLMQL